MAYTYQKAEEHIQTGKFNTVASPNNTLTAYGDHFAQRLGVGYAAALLEKIVYELIDRETGVSTSKYSGPLSTVEKAKVGRYCKALGFNNPLDPGYASPIAKAIVEAGITDDTQVKNLLTDVGTTYYNAGLTAWLSARDITTFAKEILKTNTVDTNTHIAEIVVMSLFLIFNTIGTKLNKTKPSIAVTNVQLNWGTPATIALTFSLMKNNIKGCIFDITSAVDNISANDIKLLCNTGIGALLSFQFSTKSKQLYINTPRGYLTRPGSFAGLFKELSIYC